MSVRALPPGWSWATFDAVARVDSNLVDPAKQMNMPHLAPNHMESKTGRLLEYGTIASDGVKSPKHLFSEEHLLYSKIRPYLAKATYPGFAGLCSADVYPVLSDIDRMYLLYWLVSDEFTLYTRGSQGRTVLPKLNQEALRRMPVPVPPLAEQRRIVLELERRISHVAAAERSLHVALVKLALTKSSVLEAVASGDLEGVARSARVAVAAGDVADIRGGIQKQPKRKPTKNKYPFLRVANVGRGTLDLADVHEVELFNDELAVFALQTGDLLVVEGNGSVEQIGRAATWDGSVKDCVHQNHLIRLRPNEQLNPAFLEMVWNAPSTRAQLVALASSTTGLHTLSTAKVKAVALALPDMPSQLRLVDEAQRRLSLVGAAEKSLLREVSRCSLVRASVFAAAFSGELVPQRPEEDEPAEALLERIKSSRPRSSRRNKS